MPRNTGDETKSEIKLNRKMRMWNKYRNYFITGVVIVIVLIVLAPCKRQNTGEHSHAENNRYKLFHLFSLS